MEDQSNPGYVRLQEIERLILQPGETTSVPPLNDGTTGAAIPTVKPQLGSAFTARPSAGCM